MCSRYALNCAPMDLVGRYGLTAPPRGGLPIPEVRPTDAAPVVRGGSGILLRKRFGLPSPRDGKPLINARAETISEKPTFRPLLENRCLVPATAYFEWRKDGKARLRNTIAPTDAGVFSFAAIFQGEYFIIITAAPSPAIAGVHDRMPVILPLDAEADWLSDAPFESVRHWLTPYGGAIAAEEDPPPGPGGLFG